MLSHLADVIEVVVIEDDPGDALIAEEYLAEERSGTFDVHWSKTLAEGIAAITPGTHCVLLDLGLPDSHGVSALETLRAAKPRIPIVVLTGFNDRAAGTQAVKAGAQDYLVKGEVTPPTLARSIAYAIARAGNEDRDLQLLEADLRGRENQRLTGGLKPHLQVRDPALDVVSLYQPANEASLLGGDFLDAIEQPDGTIRMVLGDVAGHGPEEAALGVSLRVGWRSLVLSGCAETVALRHLESLLAMERPGDFTYATVCELTIAPDRRTATVCLAGHPPPILVDARGGRLLDIKPDPPLGVPDTDRSVTTVELEGAWRLLAFSDGVFEGSDGRGGRLGLEAFARIAVDRLRDGSPAEPVLRGLLQHAESLHGGPLDDDVAMLGCGLVAT